MNKGYGALSGIQDIALYDYETVCGASSIQKTFPNEFEIPIAKELKTKNQDCWQCCVAEIISQISEAQYKEEMSEGYIYGNFREENDKYTGMYVVKALDFWKKMSTLPKSYCDILCEMPELRKKLNNIPELKTLFDQYKISGYLSLNYALKDKRDLSVKDALYSKDKAYNYGLLAVSKEYFDECHCIWLIGWNDKNKTYKIKNSWGNSYGNNGIKEIPKDAIDEIYMVTFDELKLPFSDVKESDWFYDFIKHMYFSGLMNGTSSTAFEPNKPITRAEAATLMWRIVKNIDNRFKILNQTVNEKIK